MRSDKVSPIGPTSLLCTSIEQQKQVDTISKQINPLDNEGLLAFGSDLQKQMSQFSHQMLDEVQSKDVGPLLIVSTCFCCSIVNFSFWIVVFDNSLSLIKSSSGWLSLKLLFSVINYWRDD
jgi:hypothetical protein